MDTMNISRNKTSDAYDSRCYGLVGSPALKSDLRTKAFASDSLKANGPFYSQECLSEAVVRKCCDKEDHFAHYALKSPTGRRGDMVFHHSVRDELLQILKRHFPEGNWEKEKKIRIENGSHYIQPDLCGYFGPRSKESPAVALEVQISPYSPRYIRKKTEQYAQNNINVLWLVPLTKPLEKLMFRPRRYELFLHTNYLGYVFYYVPGDMGWLSPIHYSPAFRYIEERIFFDQSAQEQRAGGFYLKYKTQKIPNLGNKVAVHDLITKKIAEWQHPTNKNLNVSERKIMAVKGKKWWEADEDKAGLANDDEIRYFREHFTDKYTFEDEASDYQPTEDLEVQ
jgi:competence protein CoiA